MKTLNTEFLPNFIFMTNFCEGRGYEVKFKITEKGVKGDLYFKGSLYKEGKKYFKGCLEAQKKIYTVIYKILNQNANN